MVVVWLLVQVKKLIQTLTVLMDISFLYLEMGVQNMQFKQLQHSFK